MIGAMFLNGIFVLKNFRLGEWAHFLFKIWHILVILGLIKCLLGANGQICIKKWSILITLDWLEEFFNKFCIMNRANSALEVILIAYPKNSCLGQMDHLGPRMSHLVSQLWICYKDCFTILNNERGQERHGI